MMIEVYKHEQNDSEAYTLNPKEVGYNRENNIRILHKMHDDGWTISGEVHEDYVRWVNDFYATHPVYGKLYGNFEEIVYAESQEAYDHFFENHTPKKWDYWDI